MEPRPQLEARSLSTINYLAANPPQYPYHPELRESLTLYISRVPGTQDIILSTFRPQKKNVTGEDISHSLYYVHFDSPEDGLLAAPPRPGSAVSPRSSSESARSAIPRKPLPASANIARPETSAGNSEAPHHSLSTPPGSTFRSQVSANHASPPRPEVQPLEGPVEGYRDNPMFRKRRSGASSDAPDLSPQAAPSATLIPRKPFGPRPPSISGPGRDVRPVTPIQPATPAAPLTNHQALPITSPTSARHAGEVPSPAKSRRPPSCVAFSLTIIRRDPTSGAQCNVGKVSSFQTNVPTPDTADPSLDPDNMGDLLPHAQKMRIHLETSGYAKYRDMPGRGDVDAHRPYPGHSFAQQLAQGSMTGPGGERPPALKPAWKPVEDGFSREVVMSYGGSWKSNFKKAFQRKDRPGSAANVGGASAEDQATPQPFHTRHGSASTIGSVDSADGRQSPTTITHPGPGRKPKGYVFLSPWNGKCEFRTSTNGRGLKCRHILDPTSARLDPREVAQSIREAQAMGRSRGDELSSALVGAKPVSELRFNLPQRASDREGGPKGANHLAGHFSKLLHSRARSSDEESDEENDDDYDNNAPMDLSLGRERAGGGSRGRRAKLGKLIVHDEGLKMLDLVVAANVGVWWATWGRTL